MDEGKWIIFNNYIRSNAQDENGQIVGWRRLKRKRCVVRTGNYVVREEGWQKIQTQLGILFSLFEIFGNYLRTVRVILFVGWLIAGGRAFRVSSSLFSRILQKILIIRLGLGEVCLVSRSVNFSSARKRQYQRMQNLTTCWPCCLFWYFYQSNTFFRFSLPWIIIIIVCCSLVPSTSVPLLLAAAFVTELSYYKFINHLILVYQIHLLSQFGWRIHRMHKHLFSSHWFYFPVFAWGGLR